LISTTELLGQNCFVSTDLTGANEVNVSEIETSACQLIDSLPINSQVNFKILDYAYYAHQVSFAESLDDANSRFISQSNSDYYLFFARQFVDNQSISVKLLLPQDDFFSCLLDDELKIFEYELNHIVKAKFSSSNSANEAIQTGIEYLYSFILKQKECCIPGNRSSNSCANCPGPELVLDMANSNDYNILNLDDTRNVVFDINDNTDDNVYEFSSYEIKYNNSWYDLNDIVKSTISSFNSTSPVNLNAEIHYLDYSGCLNAVQTINGDAGDENLRLRIVAIETESGEKKIATKLFQNSSYGDGCGILMTAVKLFLEDLGASSVDIEKAVTIQNDRSEKCKNYYCKYARLDTDFEQQVENILNNWDCCFLDSVNKTNNASHSPEICIEYTYTDYNPLTDAPIDRNAELPLQLKYYPDRCNSIGLVAANKLDHQVEGGLEWFDGILRDLIGKDNLLIDMHIDNAQLYISNRNRKCNE